MSWTIEELFDSQQWEKIFLNFKGNQTGSGAHPASNSMHSRGSFHKK